MCPRSHRRREEGLWVDLRRRGARRPLGRPAGRSPNLDGALRAPRPDSTTPQQSDLLSHPTDD
jgi:hypothetical protein